MVNKKLKIISFLTIFVFTFITISSVKVRAAAPSWPVIQYGNSGSNVVALQYLLNNRGYGIAVDGSFGTGTLNAVKSFQSANGLSADGVAGQYTLTKLITTIWNGSNNSAVKACQYLLNAKNKASLVVDGDFGPGTESAVRSFQSSKGITADGVVGPTTWQYLFGSSPTSTTGGVQIQPVSVSITSPAVTFYAPSYGLVPIQATASNNIRNPYAFYGDSTGVISLGTLNYNYGNTYSMNWYPDASCRGGGSRAFSTLKVYADGQNNYNYDSRGLYITWMDRETYASRSTSTWSVKAGATRNYNCLAYVEGYTNRRLWYWFDSSGEEINPSVEQCAYKLSFYGFTRVYDPSKATMIAYGNNGVIKHFAKITGPNTVESKWGDGEVIVNNCVGTYDGFTDITYGKPLAYFRANY